MTKTLIVSTATLALLAGAALAQDVVRLGTEGAYPPFNNLNAKNTNTTNNTNNAHNNINKHANDNNNNRHAMPSNVNHNHPVPNTLQHWAYKRVAPGVQPCRARGGH